MKKKSVYSVIMSKDVKTENDFFTKVLDFKETFSSEWYVSLESDGFELAVMDYNHETIPETFRKICNGVIINIEYDDVDTIYSKIAKDLSSIIIKDICDEDFGQRHFIISSPSGVLIDLIQVIPPSAEFINNYVEN